MPYLHHVTFDREALLNVAYEHALGEFELPKWDMPWVEPQGHKAFARHCFWWNVINFCFSFPSHKNPGSIKKFQAYDVYGNIQIGSCAMAACFYRNFGDFPVYARDMRRVLKSFSKFKKIFRGANSSMPMLKKRYRMLCEACDVLEDRFDGDPFNILEEGNFTVIREDGTGILRLLVDAFPTVFRSDTFFNDGSGNGVFSPIGNFYFLKRAQLFLLMYHDRAVQSNGALSPLRDVFHIGPIADYQLPRGYRADGILKYSPNLACAVDNAKPLYAGGKAELEIRIATTFACWEELSLFNYLRDDAGLPSIHMGHLDFWRWKRGKSSEGNPHLCFTTNY